MKNIISVIVLAILMLAQTAMAQETNLKKFELKKIQIKTELMKQYGSQMQKEVSTLSKKILGKTGNDATVAVNEVHNYYNTLSDEQKIVFREILLQNMKSESANVKAGKIVAISGIAIIAIGYYLNCKAMNGFVQLPGGRIEELDVLVGQLGAATFLSGGVYWLVSKLVWSGDYKKLNQTIEKLHKQLEAEQNYSLDILAEEAILKCDLPSRCK